MPTPSCRRLPLLLLLATTVVLTTSASSNPSLAFAPSSVSSMSSSSAQSTSGVCNAAAASASSAHAVPISRIGYGTYRIGGGSADQAQSLRDAILNGISLIDTSANYGNGEAEETIGQVLKALIEEGKVTREQVVVVSKFGYIQGQNMARYQSGEVKTPDTVEVASYLAHCIHPEFMRDQLTRSLARMGLPGLEVFLLHNPEYYLTHNVPDAPGAMDAATLETHRAEMGRRIYEAFKALEEEIATKQGRLKSYGISSNSFSLPPSHPHFLRYEHLVEVAQKAAQEVHGKDATHHFSTIQLPGNLLEQEGLDHAVEWAAKHGLYTLINRPLNAFTDKLSLRLAEYADARGPYTEAREKLLAFIDAQNEAGATGNYRIFRAEIEEVDERLGEIDNVLAWENVASRMVVPGLRRGLEATADAEGTFDAQGMALAQSFLNACEHLVSYQSGVHAREVVETTLEFGALPVGKSLQEFAVEWLLARPAVTCVLLGCRNTRYVQDAIKINAQFPPTREFAASGV